MTPVYIDASSAILLEKTNLFEPLSRLFDLVAAAAVYREITQTGYAGASAFTQAYHNGGFSVQSPLEPGPVETCPAPGALGCGETETLCLFLVKRQGFVLIDDGQAARWCQKNKIPFINSLLVPKIFWYTGLMTHKQSLDHMNALCRIGRYAGKIQAFAFACTPKELSFFMPEPENAQYP